MNISSRQHPRVAATFPITYTLVGDSVVRHASTRDISGGGLSFEAQDESLHQNVTIAVAFEVRGIRVAARGRVVGCSHEAAKGVRTCRVVFADISFETQTLLAAFVLRNSLDAILAKARSSVV